MLAASLRTTRVVLLGWLLQSCSVAIAFQRNRSDDRFSSEPRVAIAARIKPGLATDSGDVPRADLRVDVPLVLIPVYVTTPLGASVTGLNKENFRLFEDNVEQKITHFACEDAPASIGLVFDTSGSMQNKMRKAWEAAAEFFKIANPDDEFFLVEFNERPKLVVPFTRDSGDIYGRIAHARPFGRTSLLDAIHLALVQMKRAQNSRKAIVILSDGGDNHSRYREGEIKEAMLEADLQVFAMGIFDADLSRRRPAEERNGPHLLGELAEETGGRHFPVENLNELPDVCARIGAELRNQYVLGYTPANSDRDGRYRRVKVMLAAPPGLPPLRAHFRRGYYAPSQ